jgi:hypothetical protein
MPRTQAGASLHPEELFDMADETASTLQRWSTEDVPPSQRFEYYTEEFSKVAGTPMWIVSANPEV